MFYRLHKSVLAARLDLFGGMFILSNGQRQPEDGQDDDHAVQIEDGIAVREDFEALIKHIYGQCVSYPTPIRTIDRVDMPGGPRHRIQSPSSFRC